jgi:hypothetical protein
LNQVVCAACGEHYVELPLLVCQYDQSDLRQSLHDLAEWYDAMLSPPVRGHNGLPTEKVKEQPSPRATVQDRSDRTKRSSGASTLPSPVSDHVMRVRAEILEILLGWAALHWERNPTSTAFTAPITRAMPTTIDDLVRYLNHYEEWFLVTDAAEAYVTEVLRLAVLAQRTAAPGRREGVVIAVHQVDVGTDQLLDCGNVWASGTKATAIGRCAGCGLREPVTFWLKESPPDPDELLTDDQAVSYFAIGYGQVVAQKTIRTWRHRNEQLKAAARRRGCAIVTPRKALDDLASAKRWSPLHATLLPDVLAPVIV